MLLFKTCLFITQRKILDNHMSTKTINSKYQHQRGMMSLNCLMVLIQCQMFKIISSISTKCEALTINPPIHIYINGINNRLTFKIKDGHKLELQF